MDSGIDQGIMTFLHVVKHTAFMVEYHITTWVLTDCGDTVLIFCLYLVN